MLIRLSIDFEHEGRRWWDHGGRELWAGILESGEDDVVLDEALARSWLAQAEAIEGWDDGPDYAPHPVTARPVDDDGDV